LEYINGGSLESYVRTQRTKIPIEALSKKKTNMNEKINKHD